MAITRPGNQVSEFFVTADEAGRRDVSD